MVGLSIFFRILEEMSSVFYSLIWGLLRFTFQNSLIIFKKCPSIPILVKALLGYTGFCQIYLGLHSNEDFLCDRGICAEESVLCWEILTQICWSTKWICWLFCCCCCSLLTIPWRRKWLPTPVFLPGQFHGQRSPAGLQSLESRRVRHDWATNSPITTTFLKKILLKYS